MHRQRHNVASLGAPIQRKTIAVEMSDGVRLATDVLIPEGLSRGTILERTPYGRESALHGVSADRFHTHLEDLCRQGFAVVVQDCRGTGDSEGEFIKYVNEAADGVDTIAWASRQPWWGEGALLMGVSYSAHAALAAAVAGATGIIGMLLDRGGFWSAFHEGIRLNGAFELKQATWGLAAARRAADLKGDSVRKTALDHQRIDDWLQRLPWRHGRSPLRFDREREDDLLTQWDRSEFDQHWQQPSLSARGRIADLSPFPSLHISSWYDIYPLSTVKTFDEMNERPGGDPHLILGPWTHSGMDDTHAGDVEFGPGATITHAVGSDYLELRRRWFDEATRPLPRLLPRATFFLMGGGSGDLVEGRVHHGGEWLAADRWPPGAEPAETWRLDPRGALARATGDASLSTEEFATYIYDPRNPVPTIGGGIGSFPGVYDPGAYDQRERPGLPSCVPPYLPLLARPDVLAFVSEPLEADSVIAGSPTVHLDFSTTAEDTDISVKLIDCYPPSEQHPDGFAMNLCDTVVRLSAVDEPEIIENTVDRTVTRLTIELPPIANRFSAGHAIRLDISSSNFPRVDANPNLRPSSTRATRSVTALNGVRVGGPRASRLVLPTIPLSDLAEMRERHARGLR